MENDLTENDIAALAGELTGGTVPASCAARALVRLANARPFITKETLSVQALAPYAAFRRLPRRVYEVKVNGKRAAFEQGEEGVKFDGGGRVEITYAYLPDRVPAHMGTAAAYGAAAEYCLAESLFDEASVWEARFNEAVRVLPVRPFRLRRRAWL